MTDERQADRRSFLKTGAIAGTALVAGASAMAQQVAGLSRNDFEWLDNHKNRRTPSRQLLRLEDATLRIDERDALALGNKTRL